MKERRPPLSHTDRLCAIALLGILAAMTVIYELTDGAAIRAAKADEPPAAIEVSISGDCFLPLVEAVSAWMTEGMEPIPLSPELQSVLREACETSGVPFHLALGLIEVESGFDPAARNGACYGLCQLNGRYFPPDLAPAENIRAGVAHLGELLERYGDTSAALTAYNVGHDNGSRGYACAVLAAAEKWRTGCRHD